MVRGWRSVYGYNSMSPQAMSFEAHSLTVPSVMWLGLLPSDLQRFELNLPYFLHPPAPNWNDYVPGNCLFWFLLPCIFPSIELHLRPYWFLSTSCGCDVLQCMFNCSLYRFTLVFASKHTHHCSSVWVKSMLHVPGCVSHRTFFSPSPGEMNAN